MKMLSSRTPLAPGLFALAATAGVSYGQCDFTPLTLRNATTTWTQQCDGRWAPSYILDADPLSGWALGDCWAVGDRTMNQTVAVEVGASDALITATRIRIRILSGGYSSCCGGGNLTLGAFRLSVTVDSQATFGDGRAYDGDVGADWITLAPDVMVAKACDRTGNSNNDPSPTLSLLEGDVILASGENPMYAWYTFEADLPVVYPSGVRLELIDLNGADLAPLNGLPTGGPGRHANGNLVVRKMTADAATASGSVEISEQPYGSMVCFGGEATLSVSTPTPGVSYQWRRGGVNIPGATAASIHILDADESDEGLYDCVLTSGCATASTKPALLNVCRPEFNCDGFLDFFDYADFVAAFEAGEPRADYNRDGFLDFFDYGWYVDDFEIGC